MTQETQNKTKKIGARVLSPDEIRLTLPTYTKLKDQIAQIRSAKWNPDEFLSLQNQTTNNIGILGPRGSGKTSIIKTLIHDLEKENDKQPVQNIVLPMIIPESMSESSNLMSMILGLFKAEVDRISNENSAKHKQCWELTQPEIVNQYNELVKKFCLIQPDFKTVSIEQYTTENDYVRKSSEIYYADIDFLNSLNQFIGSLLNQKDKKNKSTLIFIFIDDIDLSTQRCVDLVKTLLAYISHPRIVTILSGDLETFEEALTLDFSRKDGALRGSILEKTFMTSGEDSFLKRKQTLTYEYLKKVIPPLYRHHVRSWSLETRGDYLIKKDSEENENLGDLTLTQLLPLCFEDNSYCPIFQYLKPTNHSPSTESSTENKTTLKNLPQMFHIFDNTARGLNNIYNILLDADKLTNDLKNPDDITKFQQIKLILETIVSSNYDLSLYQNTLFDYVIRFGSDFDSTEIICSNFKELLEEELAQEDQQRICFTLFVFFDFAIRALRKPLLLENSIYREIKIHRIADLINIPTISGNLSSLLEMQKVQFSSKEKKLLIIGEKKSQNAISKTALNIRKIIFSLLVKLDFSYALILYQYLSEGKDLFFKKDAIPNKNIFLSIYDMIKSVEQTTLKNKTNIIAHLFKDSPDDFKNILSILNSEKPSIIIDRIFSNFFKTLLESDVEENDIEESDIEESDIELRLIVNAFTEELKGLIFEEKNNLQPFNEIKKESYQGLLKQTSEDKKRLDIIFAIDEQKLWNNDFSAPVKEYVKKQIDSLMGQLKKIDLESEVDISVLQSSYDRFEKIFKGGNSTLASQLYDHIQEYIALKTNTSMEKDEPITDTSNKLKPKISLEQYKKLEQKITRLAYSSHAWYGISEALHMLSDLHKSCLLLIPNAASKNDPKPQLFMWMHIYAISSITDLENIYTEADEMVQFVSSLYQGLERNSQGLRTEYRNSLLKDPQLSEDTLSQFEELFATTSGGNE